jgi:serine/threonine protein kinase
MVNVVLLQEYLLVVYRQIISGIKFMYSKKILHRDLKPSNILISKNNIVKIADFGTSKIDRNN